MKEKEPESYIEKTRVHRDRSKKRRLTLEEKLEDEDSKPRTKPYKRNKNWPSDTEAGVEEDNGIDECPIHEKLYEDDGFGCPYCTEEEG